MKLIKSLLMAMPLALILFSCSQEESKGVESPKHEVNLTIGFSLSSGLKTRAIRDLESIDSWQRVTDMRVYVFRSENGEEGTFKLYYPDVKDNNTGGINKQPYIYVPQFEKGSFDGNDGTWTSPRDEKHTISISSIFPDGYYRLLAVGYDDAKLSPVKINWTEGVTDWDNALLINEGNTPVASEIFTGYPRDVDGKVKTLSVSNDVVNLSADIECRRAVAGVLLYLKNIPSHWVAEDSWNPDDEVGTGIISIGLQAGTDLKIHEVALVTACYNPQCNAVTRHWEGDLTYDASRFKLTRLASVSLNPDEADEDGYHNRVFKAVGNFVMPSDTYSLKTNPLLANYRAGLTDPQSHILDSSLYLCFFTKTMSGDYFPLKLWPVKLVRSYTQDLDAEDECAGELNLTRDDPYHFNFVANHLYGFGLYKKDGTIDEPVDLKKIIEDGPNKEISITVVGSWQWEVNIEM